MGWLAGQAYYNRASVGPDRSNARSVGALRSGLAGDITYEYEHYVPRYNILSRIKQVNHDDA